MKNNYSRRVTKSTTQINDAPPAAVFPLLCPEREKDWIDGWEYEMIYSQSGLAELGCVFTTAAPAGKTFTWYVSTYDPKNFKIEFVRMVPDEMVVKINIQLTASGKDKTAADISYEYTSMNENGLQWMEKELDASFANSMLYWEKAINHYLATHTKLLK